MRRSKCTDNTERAAHMIFSGSEPAFTTVQERAKAWAPHAQDMPRGAFARVMLTVVNYRH